jgi:phosphomannomutase/phosphoglucomutase
MARGALLGLALAVLISPGAWAQETPSRQPISAEAQATLLVQQIAQEVADTAKALELVSRDPGVIRALRGGNIKTIEAKAQALTVRFKHALKLRLLPPGIIEPRMDEIPPLSYASLEMLNRAELSDTPVDAELLFFGGPKQHIVMVRRIADKTGKLVGMAHLSLAAEFASQLTTNLSFANAYLELQQPVQKGDPIVLASAGQKGVCPEVQPVTLPVSGTRWSLAYWPAEQDAKKCPRPDTPEQTAAWWQPESPSFLPLVGGASLGLLAMLALLIRKRRKPEPSPYESRRDNTVYEGAVKAIMHGYYPEIEHLIPHLENHKRPDYYAEDRNVGEDTIPNIHMHLFELEEDSPVTEETAQQTSSATETANAPPPPAVSDSIFRAYDIRGVVGETLTEEAVYLIGRALGSEAHDRGQQTMVVARDGRLSGPSLSAALERGLRESGRDVIDIGMVPTPVLYFATYYLDTGSGVMLTGSHNPANYNGLKIVLDGKALSGDAITAIRDRIKKGNFTEGRGDLRYIDISANYIRRITDDIPVALTRPFKVVVDCGNGVPGILAPKLIRALGHDVTELFCEVDGNFPNHHPDPSQPKNVQDLIDTVIKKKADLGLAFDGDGDRLGVVDSQGNIIWPDRQMMLFARDVLSRNPGAEIIFDVKCSRHLKRVIEEHGGKPLMWKTGHSLIKTKMRENNAPLAGEMSGHIFFKERWYGFDDALYAAARLLEILVKDKRKPIDVFNELPGGVATPEIRLDMPETQHAEFMQSLISKAAFKGAEPVTVDGLRVDFPDGWGLIRPSNTTPCLILRFEADNQAALERIQGAFRQLITAVRPDVKPPF